MARYQALELSFVDNRLVQPGEIVEINDKVAEGGMDVGANFVAVDEDGNPVAAKGARRRAQQAPAADPATDAGTDGLA